MYLNDTPMNIFTYLTKKQHKKIIKFLDQELSRLDGFVDPSLDLNTNKYLLDYSKSLFITSSKDDNDSITLN